MKISITYYSETGNTENLARSLETAWLNAGAEVYIAPVNETDANEFLQGDILVFASPACGTEEVNDSDMLPFIENLGDKLQQRDIFLCGTFGWGDGEYLQAWSEKMQELGCREVHQPYACLESPDADAEEELAELAEDLLKS